MKLYHGTTRTRLIKILKKGLQARVERLSYFHFDGKRKRIKAVALTTIFNTAVAYASRKAHMFGGIPLVIILNYPRNKLRESYETATNEGAFVSLRRIPPKYITGFKIVKLMTASSAAKELGLEVE